MTYLSTKFSDFWHGSMLAALTACMTLALAGIAHAAPPDTSSVRVPYGDLDITREQGANTLRARIAAAAHQVCAVDGLDIRNLQAYWAARSCEAQAIARALNEVHAPKVAASLAARHEHT